jgi:phosphoglucosamine mutase
MTSNKTKEIFGTDGVRGRANFYPMTAETALALGKAAARIFTRAEGKPKVVIGKDTRLSCYLFENALIAGLCSMGVDTLQVGALPTPGVAFITRAYRANAGVVISASHNPYYDNGIKFFSADGFKLSDSLESEIENLVHKNNFKNHLPEDWELGRNKNLDDAGGRYIEFVKATFNRKLSLKHMKIALDCANGAAHRVAPIIFQELDANVFIYGAQPNGLNINDNCGALHPETVQKAVIEHHAHVGIALDGDADRVMLVDENAQIVDGDTLLAICARDMKNKAILKNNLVVSTVMANIGFHHAMRELGIEVVVSPVGDRYVIQSMMERGANLGGEQSGHLVLLDHNTTGDGLVAALQVLRIMIETDSKLSDLAAMCKKYPQTHLNVYVSSKPDLEALVDVQKTIKTIQHSLNDSGRVLVRYSGTENVCRVMVEGPTHKLVDEYAQSIAEAIKSEIGA